MDKIKQKIFYLKEYASVIGRPKVLFVWIPKNAGTSTYEAFNSTINMKMLLTKKDIKRKFTNKGSVTFGHIGVEELLKHHYVKEDYYKQSYVFCISRNPYDRFVSLLHYLKKHNRIPNDCKPIELITNVMKGIPPVGLYNYKGISQCNPQVDWINGLQINKVLRFEHLVEDTLELSNELNIKLELPHENQSINRKDYYDELDERTIELIQIYYKEDFNRFNYPIKIDSKEHHQ